MINPESPTVEPITPDPADMELTTTAAPPVVEEVDAPWLTKPWDGNPRPEPIGPWTGNPAPVESVPDLTPESVQVVLLGVEVRAQFGMVIDGHLGNPKVMTQTFPTLPALQADGGACVVEAWEQLKQNPNLTVG